MQVKISAYSELDFLSQNKIEFVIKVEQKDTAKVNIPKLVYPNQHTDVGIPHGSRDHFIVKNILRITFNLYIVSTNKTSSVINVADRALLTKKVLMLLLRIFD